jgi:polyadenylate-binding protein
MNGKMIGRKPLYVAVAQRKEERKAQLQVILLHTHFNGHIGNIVIHFEGAVGACLIL